VDLDSIDTVLEMLPEVANKTENWKGEGGGRGIRAVARYIYQPPNVANLSELAQIFNRMEGFMLVRHPFVRLVSAYEDKMLNPHPFPYKYHHKVQEQIKEKIRINKKKRIFFPKDLLRSRRYQLMLRNQVITLAQLRSQPSFPEFVTWLIKDRTGKDDTPASWEKDNTWTPYYTVCPVCDLDFSVLKLDGDRDEIQQFIEKKKLNIKRSSSVHTKGGARHSADKADKYFSELTKSQVDQLYRIFIRDFQLFGYSPKEYLDLAKDDAPKQDGSLDDEQEI